MSIVELLYFEFTEYGEIVLGTIKKYVIDHIRMRLMKIPGVPVSDVGILRENNHIRSIL